MSTLLDLTDRVAIITGGGTGVGAATAKLLAEHGAHVVIASRKLENLERVAMHIRDTTGRRAMAVQLDVRDEDGVISMVAQTKAEFGRIDILVNNAGGARGSSIEATTGDGLEKVLGLNLKGAFFCTREVGRVMIGQKRGAIVNISSMAGFVGVPGTGAYGPAKAGLQNLTRLASLDWGEHNIRVNCIALGFIATERSSWDSPQFKSHIAKQVPLGRAGRAEEVANTVLFLASDAASYISGETFAVSGGLVYVGRIYEGEVAKVPD